MDGRASAPADEAWTALLESASLSTSPPSTSVLACVAELHDNGRPALLSLLKRSGVVSLSHRQKMASALGKACRPDSLHTAADAGDAQALRAALAVMPGGENIDVLSGAGWWAQQLCSARGNRAACRTNSRQQCVFAMRVLATWWHPCGTVSACGGRTHID